MHRAAIALCLFCSACGAEDELASESFEARVCAEGPVVEGVDISKWQSNVDWAAMANDGVQFAFIRTNHGIGDLDEKYFYNWAEAKRVGILRGTYQYWLPAEDPIEQANVLLDRMVDFDEYDLPPVLDVEESQGESPEVLVDGIHQWMDHVEAALGVKPIIYTAKYFWQDGVGSPSDFLDYPLWVANYGVECPLIADPWQRWTLWQYSSSGSVSGNSSSSSHGIWKRSVDRISLVGNCPPLKRGTGSARSILTVMRER